MSSKPTYVYLLKYCLASDSNLAIRILIPSINPHLYSEDLYDRGLQEVLFFCRTNGISEIPTLSTIRGPVLLEDPPCADIPVYVDGLETSVASVITMAGSCVTENQEN